MTNNRTVLLGCAVFMFAAQHVLALPVGNNPDTGLSDQWYLGLGGGSSFLQPNPVQPSIDPDENEGRYATVLVGRDMGRLASLQLQFHELGSVALLDSENTSYREDASYSALGGTLLYRFFDTRDNQLVPGKLAMALYGHAGLGRLSRDIDSGLELKNKTEFFLSYGVGAEIFLNRNFSFRLQGAVIDKDVQYAGLSLVTRFGGSPVGPRQIPVDDRAIVRPNNKANGTVDRFKAVPGEPVGGTSGPVAPAPVPPTVPVDIISAGSADTRSADTATPQSVSQGRVDGFDEGVVIGNNDMDNDGIANSQDECNDSLPGFPVRASGCALFNGVLSAVRFEVSSDALLPASISQLEALANVLKRYPGARIQILAHTDTSITETEQAILTRGRIRTIGIYLLSQDIRANRLILRSMGGSVPVASNATASGRALNNRIELLEYR